MEDIQGKYDKLLKGYNTLLAENEELKSILQKHGIAYSKEESMFSHKTFPAIELSLEEKIALFGHLKFAAETFIRPLYVPSLLVGGVKKPIFAAIIKTIISTLRV